eukprot:TRINITY_DN33907_c0_g1_i1.p1 TRINITY_DN33907_c0_g1~~TRINITY_DN33907_c0_g1_i1.p1  ORF type:complete len:425 (+),score=73.22 TRINITY_DN33907_c0_g1_i1:42-1277(+)
MSPASTEGKESGETVEVKEGVGSQVALPADVDEEAELQVEQPKESPAPAVEPTQAGTESPIPPQEETPRGGAVDVRPKTPPKENKELTEPEKAEEGKIDDKPEKGTACDEPLYRSPTPPDGITFHGGGMFAHGPPPPFLPPPFMQHSCAPPPPFAMDMMGPPPMMRPPLGHPPMHRHSAPFEFGAMLPPGPGGAPPFMFHPARSGQEDIGSRSGLVFHAAGAESPEQKHSNKADSPGNGAPKEPEKEEKQPTDTTEKKEGSSPQNQNAPLLNLSEWEDDLDEGMPLHTNKEVQPAGGPHPSPVSAHDYFTSKTVQPPVPVPLPAPAVVTEPQEQKRWTPPPPPFFRESVAAATAEYESTSSSCSSSQKLNNSPPVEPTIVRVTAEEEGLNLPPAGQATKEMWDGEDSDDPE